MRIVMGSSRTQNSDSWLREAAKRRDLLWDSGNRRDQGQSCGVSPVFNDEYMQSVLNYVCFDLCVQDRLICCILVQCGFRCMLPWPV
jgi:hypothetical protein